MASRLEKDLSCPICCELFRLPVVLTCSHSFCQDCLQTWWKDKPLKNCPVCQKTSSSENPPLNLALKNLVETFSEETQQMCSVHFKKLRLFCEDHEEPICLVCRDSKAHKGHSFRPIEEAAQELREELKKSLKPHQDDLQNHREQLELAVAHISAQARSTEKQIRAEFEKLHQFLKKEEESRLKELREEEEQKTQRMKDFLMSRDMKALSQMISETEDQLKASDTSFLIQYKDTVMKAELCYEWMPCLNNYDLIDQVKHLGNLSFNIWRNMKSLVTFYPVRLDPNSATSDLVLSEDLSSVRRGEPQKLPENLQRSELNGCGKVKGSEWFWSGIYTWDVEVGESTNWTLGVGSYLWAEDNPEEFCVISFTDGKYSFPLPDFYKHPSEKKLRRVRVEVNCGENRVSFTDPDTNTKLYTVQSRIIEGGVPIFCTNDDVPLKILPKDVTVTVSNQNKPEKGQ